MKNNTSFTSENQPPTKGRKKGSKNRTTEEIRNFIQKVVDNNLDSLPEDLANMSPTNRWLIQDKLIKYFLPTLSKNDNNNLNSGDVTIRVEYTNTAENKTNDDNII